MRAPRSRGVAILPWLTILVGLACAPDASRIVGAKRAPRDNAPARAVDLAEAEAESGPWGLRFARPCGGGTWFHAGNRLVACRSVFDTTTGRYLHETPRQSPIARVGDGSLWASGYWGNDDTRLEAVVRDADFVVTRRIALPQAVARGIALDDHVVVGVGNDQMLAIDLAVGTAVSRESECAGDHEERFVSRGQLHCVRHVDGRTTVVADGAGAAMELDEYAHDVRIDALDRYVIVRPRSLEWRGLDGALLREEPRDEALSLVQLRPDAEMLLNVDERVERWRFDGHTVETAVVRDGGRARVLDAAADRLLVLFGAAVEVWAVDGDAINAETVLEVAHAGLLDSVAGRLVGPEIALHVGDAMLWYARGASRRLPAEDAPLALRDALSECTPLRRRDGELPGLEGEQGSHVRDLVDVSGFICGDGVFVRASVSDADELAEFDGETWPVAVMNRYGNGGAERWAYWWRTEHGARRIVGHYYVGGCERTHYIVTFAEVDGRLEIYTAENIERPSLIPIPSNARRVEIDEGAYRGDPSIGFQAI